MRTRACERASACARASGAARVSRPQVAFPSLVFRVSSTSRLGKRAVGSARQAPLSARASCVLGACESARARVTKGVCVCVCARARTCVSLCACACAFAYLAVCACVRACVRACVCECVCVCVCVFVCACISRSPWRTRFRRPTCRAADGLTRIDSDRLGMTRSD